MSEGRAQIYTVEEAAGILRMSESTLYRLIQRKRVPYRILPTGRRCFTQGDIDQILADAHRPAAA
jgi:excisionase family DNA binding protein